MSSEISFEHFDPRVELGNAVNDNGQVVRPRKKPGRKPNPPSPAQRKAQNRAAQRAFRERKRQEMREAEMTVKRCLYMRDQALQEANTLRQKVGELKFENNFLKGQLLTFKLACVANRVDVPKFYDANTTDAFGSETLSFSRTRGIPQALDFFLDSQQRIISFGDELDEKSLARPNHVTQGSQEQQQERRESVESVRQGQEPTSHLDVASVAPQLATHLQSSFFQQLLSTDLVPNNLPSSAVKDDAMDVDLSAYLNDLTPEEDKDHTNDSNEDEKQSASCPSFSSTSSTTSSSHDSSSLHSDASQDAHLATSAIQNWLSSATDESSEEPTTPTQSFHPMTSRDAVEHLRILKNMSKDSMSLYTPTELQRAIPHDPRIGLVPGAAMRDLMILFQDFYDADALFATLVESAIFMGGGEVGNPDCWLVPPHFLQKYWFLLPNHKPAQRVDNAVEIMVSFSQQMIQMLKRRKETMYAQTYTQDYPIACAPTSTWTL